MRRCPATLHMKREVRPDFRNVGHVRRQFQPRRIEPFEGEIPPLVGMIGTDAPHMGGHRVEYGKNGWSFFRAGLLYVAAGPQLSHMALLSHSVL